MILNFCFELLTPFENLMKGINSTQKNTPSYKHNLLNKMSGGAGAHLEPSNESRLSTLNFRTFKKAQKYMEQVCDRAQKTPRAMTS